MSRPSQTLVLDDPAAAAAERLAAVANAGGQMALAGGSTPEAAYSRLAALDVAWASATLWMGDERCVPPGSEQSNFGKVKAVLLDRLSSDSPEVHRIEGERDPREAAEVYEREIREVFGAGMPQLDLVLLGIGPDAHCASLFPGQPALRALDRLAVHVEQPGLEPLVPRVTLTLPVINAAREVLFLVAGGEKAEAVRRAFAAEPDEQAPASLVSPASGILTLMLDPAAAEYLSADDSVTR